MRYMAYIGGDVIVFNAFKLDTSTIIETATLSDEELVKLHKLTTGGKR